MYHTFMGYIFLMACVQMSFISFFVDLFYHLLPILRYGGLYFQIPSPVLLSPCISKRKLKSLNKTSFIYLILASMSLYESENIFCEKRGIFKQKKAL